MGHALANAVLDAHWNDVLKRIAGGGWKWKKLRLPYPLSGTARTAIVTAV